MITRSQKVRLGVFLVVSATLLVGTIVVVAGIRLTEKRDIYVVRYRGVSMSGLEPGASVKYNGVRVGQVEALEIDRADVEVVVVTLSLKKGTPVKKDTRAVLTLSGITGLKFIELTGGTAQSDFVEPGGEIQASESMLDRLTGRAEAIAEKAELLLNQLNKAVSDENRERVLRVVDEVEGILAENREDVRVAVQNLRTASDGLASVLAHLDTEATATLAAARTVVEGLRDGMDRQQVARVVNNLDRVTGLVRAALENSDISNSLKAVVTSTRRLLENLDVTVLRSREDLFASLSYLLESLENFSEFARNIRENPSLLLSGPKEHERELP